MTIQINSDKTITVDARLVRFVENEVRRALSRFAKKLTRVEVHFSDVDAGKTGHADKRCLIEVRPAGARPRSASAKATSLDSAVGAALEKMQRALTTFFGRKGRPVAGVAASVSAVKKTVVKKISPLAKKRTSVKKAAGKKPRKLSPRGPKKKRIYQARRKAWPAR